MFVTSQNFQPKISGNMKQCTKDTNSLYKTNRYRFSKCQI